MCQIFWIGLITRIVRHITVPSLGGLPPSVPASPGDDTYSGPSTDGNLSLSTFGLAVFLSWCVLSVVVLSPLECAIVRLSVQRPERQQPLHQAYARLPTERPTPAPYNNQAQVSQTTEQSYRDHQTDAPTDPLPRPSFAIEDDEDGQVTGKDTDDEAGKTPQAEQEPGTQNPDQTSSPPSQTSAQQQTQTPSSYAAPSRPSIDSMEPSEPVIALRPCDEPLSREDAARAEAEGFGAPTVERYQGLIDCLNKLVDEEGIEALYRGAWLTLLGVLLGNFG